MTGDETYRPAIEAGIKQNLSAKEIYESLRLKTFAAPVTFCRPVYDESGGMDGYVSIEVSPHLARDIAGTMQEARRFF